MIENKQILIDTGITNKSAIVVPTVIKEFIWSQGLSTSSNTPIKRKSIKDLLGEFLERHEDTLTAEQYEELSNIAKRN